MTNAAEELRNLKGDSLNVKMLGVKGDGTIGAGTITAGTTAYTATSGSFTAANTGNLISISLAGAGGLIPFTTTIAAVVDSSHVTLSAAPSASVVASPAVWGTDNTASIQAALYALPVTPTRTLAFPHSLGVYLTKGVLIPSNVTLHGGGWIDILDDGTATGQSLFLSGVSNVMIRDLKITSTNAGGRTGVYGNIRALNSTNVRVLTSNIVGGSSVGIHVLNCNNVVIRDNSISETWADGIHVSRGCNRVRITHNHIEHCGDDGIGLVGYLSLDGLTSYPPMQQIVVAHNHIYNLTKSVGRGIAVYGCIDFEVINNTIDTTFSAGILVGAVAGSDPTQATHYCYKGVISGNTTRNNTLAGIYVSYARAVEVIGNHIDQQTDDGISVAGVCKEVQVVSNDVARTGARGIITSQVSSTDSRLIQELYTDVGESGVTRALIDEILIRDNTVRSTVNESITCQGESSHHSTHITIAGNKVLKAASRGIFLFYCDDSSVSDANHVLSSTGEGILISDSSYVNVLGNQVLGGLDKGIALISADHCVVTAGNIVTGNAVGGVYVGPTSGNNIVTGNFTVGNTGFQVQLDLTLDTNIKFNNYGDDWSGLYFQQPRVAGIGAGTLYGFQINGLKFVSGVGSPETVVTAPLGSYYLRADAGIIQNLYIKQTGAGNTGWIQIGTIPLGGTGASSFAAADKPVRVNVAGTSLISGRIVLTSSSDVDIGSLTDQTFLIANGGAVGSRANGLTTVEVFVQSITVTDTTLTISGTTFTYVSAVGATTGSMTFTNGLLTA